ETLIPCFSSRRIFEATFFAFFNASARSPAKIIGATIMSKGTRHLDACPSSLHSCDGLDNAQLKETVTTVTLLLRHRHVERLRPRRRIAHHADYVLQVAHEGAADRVE